MKVASSSVVATIVPRWVPPTAPVEELIEPHPVELAEALTRPLAPVRAR